MFEAAPMMKDDARGVIAPRVFLLSATLDPLGVIAAAFRMYAGKPTYDLSEITDEERRKYWQESLDTYLKAPWEFVDFHFFIEAVTRAFTHQMVRQRTAVYAQESLRFAVKEGIAQEIPLPPTVIGNENAEAFWQQTINKIQEGYEALINMGIPAEDARGLLPHAVTTRLNYKTHMRGLFDVAGKRLCTQAQFEWRAVMLGIMQAIREYEPTDYSVHYSNAWQFELIGTPRPGTFSPICYDLGRCPYMGVLDRNCTIRERVNQGKFDSIDPIEWMANPEAGRGRD